MARRINMMISRKYVQSWDLFEGFREFYSNAVDTGDFTVDFPDADTAVITTPSNPSLSQMFVMGEGAKSEGDDTIGQFGEGAKVGALCLTRRKNTLVEIDSPLGEIAFEFATPTGFDCSTLHARIDPRVVTDDFVVTIRAKGIADVYRDKFLKPDAPIGGFEKKANTRGMRVYCKGILIKRLEETSLFDWNLQTCKLNRDRSMPDAYDLRYRIGKMVAKAIEIDPALAEKILDNEESYEALSLAASYVSPGAKIALAAAARRKYGDDMVIAASDSHINTIASYKGHKPVVLPSHITAEINDLIPKATDVVIKADRLTESTADVPAEMLAELTKLADMLGINCELKVFTDMSDGTMGTAKWCGSFAEVWINENLFSTGRRFDRIRTMLHELGHIKSGAGDATINFEHKLDWIAAKFAEVFLNR